MRLQRRLEAIWYSSATPPAWLRLLERLFIWISSRRRLRLQAQAVDVGVPVIIVGNIAVGGTGKTPFVTWLVQSLRSQGMNPGLISRGYGGRANRWPQPVTSDSDPAQVGDEAVLLAQRTACPMWVGPDRVSAARALLEHHGVDVIVSDDGLQHYRLARSFEIAVVDGVRKLGNEHLLPAGPLRESPERLEQVDLVVVNSGHLEHRGRSVVHMHVLLDAAHTLDGDQRRQLSEFAGSPAEAVAGIGHPERFFERLEAAGIQIRRHAFADHHPYTAVDLEFDGDAPILMTEKDAVKCRGFARSRCWYVPVDAVLDEGDTRLIEALLKQRLKGLNFG